MKISRTFSPSVNRGFIALALLVVPAIALCAALLFGMVSRVNTLTTQVDSLETTTDTLVRTAHSLAPANPLPANTPAPGWHELPQPAAPSFGAINTVGGLGYFLYGSGIGSSDTTLTLTYFYIPVSKQKLSMTDFGTIGYITLEPGNATKQEFVSFTGVTQNGDGTATLTGLSRGLSPISPYTASSTLQKAHAGGTQAAISNPPQLYSLFGNKSNDETVTGNWTFTGQTTFSSFPISPTNSTSSYTTSGGNQFATPAQQAAGTATSTNGNLAPLSLAAKNATSTFNSNTAANVVVVTKSGGKIDSSFVETAGGASSTVPMNDGSGNLVPYFPNWALLTATTTVAAQSINATTSAFAAHANLHVIIMTTSKSSTSDIGVNFNADYGANYGSAVYTQNQGGTPPFTPLSAFNNMQIDPGTTTPQMIEMDIMNLPTVRKNVLIRGVSNSSAASVPVIWQAAGVWNNITAPITSIGISSGGATTFGAGTTIYVYGSD